MTDNRFRHGLVAAALVAAAALGAPVVASSTVISAVGSWGGNAPTTPYSAPDENFSFSISLPSNFAVSYSDSDIVATNDVTLLAYTLNGAPVTGVTLDSVDFFDAALGGGLALAFSDYSVELYGASLGVNGALPPPFGNITSGIFFTNINGVPSPADGQLPEGTASLVPEPQAWALMLLGVGLLGGALRVARPKRALVRA